MRRYLGVGVPHHKPKVMAIQINNLQSGAFLTYSLPLLTGEVQPALAQGNLTVINRTTSTSQVWTTCHGVFKVLVELQHGENLLQLEYFGESFDFVLNYTVPQFCRYVRPIYIKCCDDDGSFQGPKETDCSSESALKRIGLGSKLLQTFTAEKLHEQGLGRRTFILEHDLNPSQPECHIFISRLKIQQAQNMSGGDLWMFFAKELMSSKSFTDKEHCKWYTFMSFTRYIPPEGVIPKSHSDILKYTKGHTALGGGGLALFGTGNLHTWAEKLEDVQTKFTDNRKMDKAIFMDDSAYREYYWANYSTGLGASLHELGHTFDLAHTPTGVMARGFDDLYRVFTVHPLLSQCSSRESSAMASPIPYSPRQSPVHRPRVNSGGRRSMSPKMSSEDISKPGSPKPCPTRSRPISMTLPGVIQIETAFKKVSLESTQMFTIKNYDGSETQKTIKRHRDGTETVSELTTYQNGDRMAREVVKHLATGKKRTTMSMNIGSRKSAEATSNLQSSTQNDASSTKTASEPDMTESTSSSSVASSSIPLSNHVGPSTLPQSPEEFDASSQLKFHQIRYKDGGAHWYRASAVLLRYHKWFNPTRPNDPKKPPVLDGNLIIGHAGLRLIELRSLPEGVVFHHWEFLHSKPPLQFRLKHFEIVDLSDNATEVTVLAADDFGNILKKKIHVEDLKEKETNGVLFNCS